LQKSLGFSLYWWLSSVSKSKVMTQVCTWEVKCGVLFWSFKSCCLCWDVLFITSGTKKITHTQVLTSFSLQLFLCNYSSQIRVILLKPDLYWFPISHLCEVLFLSGMKNRTWPYFPSLMLGF
jgi:hypothetical protein